MLNLSSEFPIAQSHSYLNTAAQGPWPTRTTLAVQQMAAQAQLQQMRGGEGRELPPGMMSGGPRGGVQGGPVGPGNGSSSGAREVGGGTYL